MGDYRVGQTVLFDQIESTVAHVAPSNNGGQIVTVRNRRGTHMVHSDHSALTPLSAPTELREVVVACTEDGRKNVAMRELRCGLIAAIQWEVETGEVYQMWVDPPRRRQGIMTRLWEEASALGARHSPWRTDDGEAFARAVGGDLPERRHA